MNTRTEQILGIARRNGGLIDLAIGLALFPEVRERTVRQLFEDLEHRGALRSGWVAGEWPQRKVWVDRQAQRRHFEDVQLVPGKTPTLVMGDKFRHKMLAAELVIGLTASDRLGDAKLDCELPRIARYSVPDGHVILQDGSLLLLELERMLRQSWEHWAAEGEIGDSIAEHMRGKANSRYIICAPEQHLLHLAEAIIKADKRRYLGDPPGIPSGYGFWAITTEYHKADVAWCDLSAEGVRKRPLRGITAKRGGARARLAAQQATSPLGVAQGDKSAPVRRPPTPAEALAALRGKELEEALRRPR